VTAGWLAVALLTVKESALAWIESHTILPRHRKVLLLAYDLKIPVVQTIGHLHAFWYTVLEQQEDGDLREWPDAMIEEAALWEGEPGVLVTRLRERGWIDGHIVHDWLEYTGPYLTKKYSSGNVVKLKEIWLKHGFKYGKGQGKFHKQKASKKRVVGEQKGSIPLPSLPNPSSPFPSEPDLTKPNRNTSEGAPTAQAIGRLESFLLTPELEAWSAKEGIHEPSQYVEEFKDYWRSAGGKRKNGQTVKDWAAAFRNRLRTLKDAGKLKPKDPFAQLLAQEMS
jgi:hypothetical protein